jgi:hypothetical protein
MEVREFIYMATKHCHIHMYTPIIIHRGKIYWGKAPRALRAAAITFSF